jgi:glycosyltransferase involved in cell wall biosynthesis
VATAARAHARRWDVLVSHWLVPAGAIADTLARGRRHLAIAHGSDARLLRALPGGHSFVRTLHRRADLVYVADALRHPRAPGRVAPMGIDVARFSVSPDQRIQARRQLAIDGFAILFLGRLIHDKGCDLLLAAVPEGATVLVAGDGPERQSLERRGGRARFFGHVAAAQRQQLLAAADVMVIPSRVDGAPTVALEAMAAGLPIVATRAGGLPELLVDGKTALLCDATAADILRALEKLQKDTQLLQQLADNGKYEAQNHDWSVAGPRLWGPMVVATPSRERCIQIFRV